MTEFTVLPIRNYDASAAGKTALRQAQTPDGEALVIKLPDGHTLVAWVSEWGGVDLYAPGIEPPTYRDDK